jgi:hypothetical protein
VGVRFPPRISEIIKRMSNFKKTNQNNQILNKLVSENCLSFGRSPKLNNRKITHYISGTRQKVDIFNLYEMRYLLLKVYPLIHNLFLQQRLNLKKKKKFFLIKNWIFKIILKNFKNYLHNYESEKIFAILKPNLINRCFDRNVHYYLKFYLQQQLNFIVLLLLLQPQNVICLFM